MSIFRHGLLANKTAIVTGGATGIGRGITKELMELGCHVIIASRDQEKLRSAAAELEDLSQNGSVEHVKCDVRNSDDVTTLMKHAINVRGKIDYLVNNGGGQFPSSAETISDKGWHAVIDTNLTGTFRMCREAVTTGNMRENGGAIVNIICTHNQGFPGMAHTGAARAGVDTLTRTLAMEWAEYGIRINSVAPGVIYSITAEENYQNTTKHASNLHEQYLSSQAPKIPMRRLGTTQECANVVTFLLSQGGSYTTGSTYTMDGGFTCAGVVGSSTFLKRTRKQPKEAFPWTGELPDFCVADDDRVSVMVDGETDVDREIKMLEMKLATLRGDGRGYV